MNTNNSNSSLNNKFESTLNNMNTFNEDSKFELNKKDFTENLD